MSEFGFLTVKGAYPLRTRGSAILMRRLGTMKFFPQDELPHAPAKKGMWAFPYPCWDASYVEHQYDFFMPKRLQTAQHITDNEPARGWSFDEKERLLKEWEQARHDWIKTIGKKVVRPHNFYYEGMLYTHLRPNGEVTDEWHYMHSSDFKLAYKKAGNGTKTYYHHTSVKPGPLVGECEAKFNDHGDYEVFFAPHEGKFTS